MSELNITVPAGQKKRLLTAGKYCEDDIIVTADGIDTSDATAAAGDIVAGKTAYVNGEKVEGTIKPALGGITGDDIMPTLVGHMPYIQMTYSVTEPTYISPESGGTIALRAPYSFFGDATANDVLAGKSFTGADGLRVDGAYEPKGEDVAAETEAYTSKLASLETAITALETELQGKTSGGSGGGVSIKTCAAIVNINLFEAGEILYNCYVDNNIMNDEALLNPMSATEFNNIIVGSMIILSFPTLVSVTCIGGEAYRRNVEGTTIVKVSVNSADGVIIDINSNSDNPFG